MRKRFFNSCFDTLGWWIPTPIRCFWIHYGCGGSYFSCIRLQKGRLVCHRCCYVPFFLRRHLTCKLTLHRLTTDTTQIQQMHLQTTDTSVWQGIYKPFERSTTTSGKNTCCRKS